MRHMAMGFLCAFGLIASANATENDYLVSKQANGFDVFEVTKDAVTTVPGSPFGSSLILYAWTGGTYIYVVNLVHTPSGGPNSYASADVLTYTMVANVPKQVAKVVDASLGYGGCGHCFPKINSMFASEQHLFMTIVSETSGAGILSYVHMYHTNNGALTFMCDIPVPFMNTASGYTSAVTNIRSDSGEIYAYINYVDPNTMIPDTAIYDISTAACKSVGVVPQ